MGQSFVIYIDESGDEGFQFQAGSSEWFVLSAIVTEKRDDLEVVKLVDQARVLIHRKEGDKEPLHFRKLKHEHRIPFVHLMAQAHLKGLVVMIHKPSIRQVERFQERNRLYFYAARLLLERVSWYCRDHRTPFTSGDGSAEICFSNRGGMKYEELRQYMAILRQRTDLDDVRVDWSVIQPDQIKALSAKLMGMQIADALASSFFFALRPQYGFTEPRYAQMLKPCIYHHKGRYSGYGLKLWPDEGILKLGEGEEHHWLRQSYGF